MSPNSCVQALRVILESLCRTSNQSLATRGRQSSNGQTLEAQESEMIPRGLKIAVPFIWFGMLLAISFMEAPLKFQAPGVTLPLGLGIGRLVFFALNKMEIVSAVVLIAAFWRARSNSKTEFALLGLVAPILLLQTAWLLPALDNRAELVIAGIEQPYSNLHVIYIVLDAIKLILLLTLGIVTTRHYLTEAGR
jgi:hypothetical protein